MSVIGNFFNKSTFSIENLTTNPRVIPDEEFEFNFYIHDVLKNGTAKDIDVKLYLKDGRNETLITNAPIAYLVDYNIWQLTATIPASEWDGIKSILMKFNIKDITDARHYEEYYLFKD